MPATATDRIDGLTTSVAIKAPCVVATVANITLSGTQTINGVACVAGDRVLVKDQTDATKNGIYVVSTSAWTRALDFDGARDAVEGTQVLIDATTGVGSWYRLTTADPVIGTSSLTFELSLFGDPSTLSFTQTGTGASVRSALTKMRESEFSVKDFGAVGDGVTDDTAAIQACLDAAEAARITGNYTIGGVSSVSYITAPIVKFPYGRYLVTALTLGTQVEFVGERSVVYGSNSAVDIFTGTNVFWLKVSKMAFIGGLSHFDVGNSNSDTTFYRWEDCDFTLSASYAILTQAYGGVYTHLSANVTVENCKFDKCNKIADNVADYMRFTHCWFNLVKDNFTANTAAFRNRATTGNARLHLDDCIGVPLMFSPAGPRKAGARWIDQEGGDVLCDRMRFGGEDAGMPIIYYSRPYNTSYPFVNGGSVVLRACELYAGPNATAESGVIILTAATAVPPLISIRDCVGPVEAPYVVNLAGVVNFSTVYSNWATATGLSAFDYFKVVIEGALPAAPDSTPHFARIPFGMRQMVGARQVIVNRSTAQTMAANSATKLSFDTEVVDNFGGWSVATPTKLFTANHMGRYHISGSISIQPPITAGFTELRILNGSGVRQAAQCTFMTTGSATNGVTHSIAVDVSVTSTAGDFFEFEFYNNTTAATSSYANIAMFGMRGLDYAG